jgi:hypothetical protein
MAEAGEPFTASTKNLRQQSTVSSFVLEAATGSGNRQPDAFFPEKKHESLHTFDK